MTWSHLLPEGDEEPAGFVDPSPSRRRDPSWQAQPLPANPRSLSLDAAVAAAYTALGRRQNSAAGTVRAWPAEDRRLILLRIHIDAVRHPGPPDDGPARLVPTLICDQIRWTRTDLIWVLRTADGWGLYDGAAFLLPGYIAASLTVDEVAGCGPALRAVFDTMLHQWQTPQATRWQVTELYGRTLGRLTHLLARVAVAAGSAAAPSRYPLAPRTAAAAGAILADRPGDLR
jgi:hypothetical protein